MSEKRAFLNIGIVLFVISFILRCYLFYDGLRGEEGLIDMFCDFLAISKDNFAGFLNVLIIVGLIVIIIHCSEFKGYKAEFWDRFPSAITFSIASTGVMFLLGAIFDHCLIEAPDDPGLVILWFVFMMMMYISFFPLLIIVPIININVWNKAVNKYNKKQKELEKSHSE